MPGLTREEIKRQLDVLVRIGKLTQAQADARLAEAGSTPRQAQQGGGRGPQPSYKSRNQRPTPRPAYNGPMSAPYRFVEIPGNIVRPKGSGAVNINEPLADGFSAEICIDWVAETPLLIGEARQRNDSRSPELTGPLRMGDAYVVPGSSFKGMVRAAMEIVTFARLSPVNDHKFGLRDFLHPGYASDSGESGSYPVGDVNKLRAGWLNKADKPDDDGNPVYELSPCDWSLMEVPSMLNGYFMNGSRCRLREDWVRYDVMRKYIEAGLIKNGQLASHKRCTFRRIGDINGKSALNPDRNGGVSGFPVFSNKAPGFKSKKRLEYVFHGGESCAYVLTAEEFLQFERIHSKPGKRGLDPDGTWRIFRPMLDKGVPIPVFFVGEPDAEKQAKGTNESKPFAMGLTRLFKVPHEYSVGDVIRRKHGPHGKKPKVRANGEGRRPYSVECDFAENLFGFVLEQDQFDEDDGKGTANKLKAVAQKGRIAFSFARIDASQVRESKQINTVMMGPRASFAPFYLRGDFKDYSDGSAMLSGRKRYLPRYTDSGRKAAGGAVFGALSAMISREQEKNLNVQTALKFLVPADGEEFKFTSRIRLHNVSRAELGAVLWVLTFGGISNCRHMLGRARPFGAGQLRARIARLDVKANRGDAQPAQEELVRDFETFMDTQVPGWLTSKPVLEYLALCDPETGARLTRENKLSYIRAVRDFGAIRKTTQPLKVPGNPPHHKGEWGGRFLETPVRR